LDEISDISKTSAKVSHQGENNIKRNIDFLKLPKKLFVKSFVDKGGKKKQVVKRRSSIVFLKPPLENKKEQRPTGTFGIQSENGPDEEVISQAQTFCSNWGPAAPDFGKIYHLNQSMGRSSTNLPEYNNL
jgi:hypothetical protein